MNLRDQSIKLIFLAWMCLGILQSCRTMNPKPMNGGMFREVDKDLSNGQSEKELLKKLREDWEKRVQSEGIAEEAKFLLNLGESVEDLNLRLKQCNKMRAKWEGELRVALKKVRPEGSERETRTLRAILRKALYSEKPLWIYRGNRYVINATVSEGCLYLSMKLREEKWSRSWMQMFRRSGQVPEFLEKSWKTWIESEIQGGSGL